MVMFARFQQLLSYVFLCSMIVLKYIFKTDLYFPIFHGRNDHFRSQRQELTNPKKVFC